MVSLAVSAVASIGSRCPTPATAARVAFARRGINSASITAVGIAVSPSPDMHAFGFDGFRWHARAYCHLTENFRDFLLPRILGAKDPGNAGRPDAEDELWRDRFAVRIAPHPDLGPQQQAIVARDYGMVDGTTVLEVRYAMLFYFLKRLNLLGHPEKLPVRSQHIVVANRSETDEALRRADFKL